MLYMSAALFTNHQHQWSCPSLSWSRCYI